MDSQHRPLKVFFYLPSLNFYNGGLGMYAQLLAKELGKRVRLYVITQPAPNALPLQNCTVVEMPYFSLVGKRFRHVFEYSLDTIRPDIVHVNNCWTPMAPFVQKWAYKKGYKTVYTPHGMLEPYIMRRHYLTRKLPALLFYQRKALRRADCLVATAEQERKNILRLGYNKQVKVVPIGLDVDSITMRSSWQRQRKIVFLSRIHEKKGIEFLLESWAELREPLRDYTLYIYGMGVPMYIDSLQSYARQLGLEGQVVFPGAVQGEDKWHVLREADLFVLPTHSENFGIAIAEALASGTPVITTKGTPWQDIDSYHCGWWTEIGKEPTKQALLEFLHKSDTDLEMMGRNGRRLIEEKYSTALMAERMVQLYEEVLT